MDFFSLEDIDMCASYQPTTPQTMVEKMNFNTKEIDQLKAAADLRNPFEIFDQNKFKVRKIIYHHGPPNSGKTFKATQRFNLVKSAVYCCPLRLMAGEVAEKTNKAGIPCDMVTGEETTLALITRYASHVACTVHVADLESKFDVAVIDEIQMISDDQNGWAFTRALIGVQAREVHVCGDSIGLPLVRWIAQKMGCEFSANDLKRKSQLTILPQSIGGFNQLKAADALICFSQKAIRQSAIEVLKCNMKPAIVYGALPPKTKKKQIDDFNSEKKDILIATDAIGMGLNAEIRRVIFFNVNKNSRNADDKMVQRLMTPLEFKQISGRAGRMMGKYREEGYIGCYHVNDQSTVEYLAHASNQPIQPIQKAGIRAPIEMIENFAEIILKIHPETKFDEILICFGELVQVEELRFFHCSMSDIISIAYKLQDMKMSTGDMYRFCMAPASVRSDVQISTLQTCATIYQERRIVKAHHLYDVIGWHNLNLNKAITYVQQIREYEDIFTSLGLYHWLSKKFDGFFPDTDEIAKMKEQISFRITEAIDNYSNMIDLDCVSGVKMSHGRNSGSGYYRGSHRGRSGRARGIRRL